MTTAALVPELFRELGAADDGEPPHWAATLVALVTVNSFIVLTDAPEVVPELAVAEVPEALALEPMLPAPSCPVTCTSFPISVRIAFKSPVSL